MKFRELYTDKDNYYSVGIDEETGEHVMEVVITWIAWYSRYFRLTDDEIQRFEADRGSLAGIARAFAGSGAVSNYGDRMILSEKIEENEIRDRIAREKQSQNKPAHPTAGNLPI